MDVFPVSDSTLSPVHVAAFVKDAFCFKDNVTARILKTGISHTYLINTGTDKYIFRIYSLNWRTQNEIAEEIRLLNLLKENGLPVSYAIADVNGSYIQQLNAPEGLRYAVLFSFAKGIKMLNMPVELHYNLGQIMAGIHSKTQNLSLQRVTYTPEVLLINSFEKLKEFLDDSTDEMIYMHSLQKFLYKTLTVEQMNDLRKGVVHLDIWFDNISIDKNEVTIFDFDFCGNGWLLLDIAYYILQVFSTEKDEKEYNLKKESFLQGYESIMPIPLKEKNLIPAAALSLYFFYLGIQCSRYDNWSNNFLNEIYLKRFINLLIKKWADFHGMNIA